MQHGLLLFKWSCQHYTYIAQTQRYATRFIIIQVVQSALYIARNQRYATWFIIIQVVLSALYIARTQRYETRFITMVLLAHSETWVRPRT